MSKLVNQIKAVGLNERSYSDWVTLETSFSDLPTDYSSLRTSPIMRQYDISIMIGSRVFVGEHDLNHLHRVVDVTKRKIINELYGEFRKPLIDLYLTILQADRESSLKKTQEIFKNMFDETL